MPVAKKNKVAYGVLVGAMQNRGMSLEEAKSKTDKALKDHPEMGKKMEKKYGKKGKSKSAPAKKAKAKAKSCKGSNKKCKK